MGWALECACSLWSHYSPSMPETHDILLFKSLYSSSKPFHILLPTLLQHHASFSQLLTAYVCVHAHLRTFMCLFVCRNIITCSVCLMLLVYVFRTDAFGTGQTIGVLLPGEDHQTTSPASSLPVSYTGLCRAEASGAFPHILGHIHISIGAALHSSCISSHACETFWI